MRNLFQPSSNLPNRIGKGFLQLSAIALLASVSSCDTLFASVDEQSNLPPCVDSYCDCGDFVSRDLAQTVLDSFQEDYYGLDRDGNGLACERRPIVDMSLDWETYFSNNEHLMWGNPSHAGQQNPDNWIIEREQYVLSYNQSLNRLNWASWWVDERWLGRTSRQDDFRPDGGLPAGFYQATPTEYRRSGYDRGHMVPSGDRTFSPRDNTNPF